MMNYLHKPLVIIDSAFSWVSELPYPFSEWYFLGTVFLLLMLLDILLMIKLSAKRRKNANSGTSAEKSAENRDVPAIPEQTPVKESCEEMPEPGLPVITDVRSLKAAVTSDDYDLSYDDICAYEAAIYNEMLNAGNSIILSEEVPDSGGVVSSIVDTINTMEDEKTRESEHESLKKREKEQRLSQIDQNLNKKIPKSLAGNTVDDIDI